VPHIIHRSQIPRGLREPRERTYKRQLRRALASPYLSEEQRERLQAKLNRLLGTDNPPSASPVPARATKASDVPTPEAAPATDSPKASPEQLLRLKKAEIINIGKAEGAPVKASMTKVKLVEAIMEHRRSG
jgi:hypothetical protein